MTISADKLTEKFIEHFWSADHSLKWTGAEVEHQVWLTPNTVVMGRMDATGRFTEGVTGAPANFFGEWKTSSPRDKKTWKQTWRKNPQSLTYGVLADDLLKESGGCRWFTVRKAFKERNDTASFDHEWFEYSTEEIMWWRKQLVDIAHEIRETRTFSFPHWPTNLKNCFAYGPDYVCQHFELGCDKLNWNAKESLVNPMPRVPHLESERTLLADTTTEELVILDATRIGTWFECREKFRREYVAGWRGPVTEEMQRGLDFHDLTGRYYKRLIEENKNGRTAGQ